MKILLLLAFAFAAPAMAYPVSSTSPKTGFYVADIASTAPVMIADGFWGREHLTPEQYVSRKCPGAAVTEINLASTPSYGESDTSVQIVFTMPQGGCIWNK